MDIRKVFLRLCVVLAVLSATASGATVRDAGIERDVRAAVENLQSAWNRGDLGGVVRQYHSTVYVRVNAQAWGHVKQVEYLAGLMKEDPRPHLRIDVNMIRPLGKDFAVVDGQFHMLSTDGRQDGGPFTAVWMRAGDLWQCIYTRS